jgi:hypothetical protein
VRNDHNIKHVTDKYFVNCLKFGVVSGSDLLTLFEWQVNYRRAEVTTSAAVF